MCRSAKLVVEVDGAHHGDASQLAHDAERDRFLRQRELKVLRFWAADILDNTDAVMEQIIAELETSPAGKVRPRTEPGAASPRHLQLTRLGLRRRD